MAKTEYIPPASAGALVTRRELEPREDRAAPPPEMNGIVAVTITLRDGTEIELRDLISAEYVIEVDRPRYRLHPDWIGTTREDSGVTARLELRFDEVVRRG